MTTDNTEKTLTSDWGDLDSSPPSETLQVGARVGSFVIGQFLGHGGMGVVYEATHKGTGAQVALKTLHRVGVAAQQRLKDEFRTLAELRHQHLVQLYELHTVDDNCFLTMERIEGQTLGAFVRHHQEQDPEFYRRLRDAFYQVAEGLIALHREGLLHLDLKPDNVMVDRSGVVKILDFGLTAQLDEADKAQGGAAPNERAPEGPAAGTPRYMAPERIRRLSASPATDWYAVGVMLAELLAPGWGGPPSHLEFAETVPPDLSRLARQLLVEEPEKRTRGPEFLEAIGARASGTYPSKITGALSHHPEVDDLVGRDEELAQMDQLLESARAGKPSWLHITGESGVGKTALSSHFRDRVRRDAAIVVLEGACRERESMPFQGLDQIMSDLARAIARRGGPRGERQRAWMQCASVLSSAFSASNDAAGSVGGDPLRKRREAFSALKSLLNQLSREVTIVLFVDDVQWGDADGAKLLAEFLATPTSGRLLILTTSRKTADGSSDFIGEVESVLSVRGTEVAREHLQVRRLSDREVRDCIGREGSSLTPQRQEAIVRASRGLPFLARALGSHPWSRDEDPSLDALVQIRLDGAPEGAAAVMRAVALSPSPLPQPVALENVTDPKRRQDVVAALRHAGLVRTAGGSPEGPLEPYHALVAETVKSPLNDATQRGVRLRIAESLEEKCLATPEHLASLYHLAGQPDEAARWAPVAAQEAEDALAFESAAHWYGRAACWLPHRSNELLKRKARCLEYAGRAAAAAETYEECAQLAGADQAALIRAAGGAWLSSGHVDRGLSVLEPGLESVGTSVPATERRGLLRSLLLLWRLWRRGTDFQPLEEDRCDTELLTKADLIWNVAKGIGVVMPMRGLALQIQCLLTALESREPSRVARSLAILGPMFMGGPVERVGLSWLEKANDIAESLDTPYVSGVVRTFEAMAMSARWENPRRIADLAESGNDDLSLAEGAAIWEQSMAYGTRLRSLEHLGQFAELGRSSEKWLAESTDRGDLFAQTMAHHACALHRIADGDTTEARRHAKASVEKWSRETFTVQHYYAIRYQVLADLYEGDGSAAGRRFEASWGDLSSALLLRNPLSRPELLLLQGLVDLAQTVQRGERRARSARSAGRQLSKDAAAVSQAHGALLHAACDIWETRKLPNAALAEIDKAIEVYGSLGLVVTAQCARLARAHLVGAAQDADDATERLWSLGVRAPQRYLRTCVPEFMQRSRVLPR